MNKINFKRLILDLDSAQCIFNNKIIELTKTEFLLLKFFLNPKNINKIFNRKAIINAIWHKKVSERTVDVAISRLKKKLYNTSYIKTRQGFGYGVLDNNENVKIK